MPDPSVEMKAYYAARAAEYDKVYQKPERQADISWLRSWLPTQFVESSVLDVAAGTGFWSRHIAGAARRLVAIDSSPETLAIARGRLPADRCRFVVGDVYELPFRRNTFTAALVGFWFSHVPKGRRQEFLSGLDGALRPGSTVVLLDNLYVEGSNHPITEVDAEGNTFQSRRLESGKEHRVLKNFPTRQELEEEVRRIGEDVDYWALNYYWAVRYRTPGLER